MSQAGVTGINSGTLPPEVPLQLTTDDGNHAVAVNHNINVFGNTTFEDNDKGIQTESANTDQLNIVLTNRLVGTATTNDATVTNVIAFNLGVLVPNSIGTFTFDITVSGYQTAGAGNPQSVGYKLFATVRSTGALANVIGVPDVITNEEGTLVPCDCNVVCTGADNIVRVQVTGIAGFTINWKGYLYYTFVGP